MRDYTKVKISNDTLLQMLLDRVEYHTTTEETKALFEEMYRNRLESGAYDGMDFDVYVIVDNDFINWCSVQDKEDFTNEEWERLKALYENGERDISCENFGDNICGSFIEAMSEDQILIRA